ncbi:MAG: ABC transporter permease [Candidatus Bathyarchaeota archaeon]|nr:ABC transporter permease [Candidatus Bathyarchaeota archaeon]
MRLSDIIFISADGLRERKRRMALNVLGILIGCAAVTGLVTLADGMNNQVRDQLSVIGTNSLFILPEKVQNEIQSLDASRVMETNGLTWRDRETVSQTLGVDAISEMSINEGQFTVKGETYDAKIMGVGAAFIEINTDLKIKEGRSFTRTDKNAVMLGKNVAYPTNKDEQILDIGDRVKLYVQVNNQPKEMTFRVVAIFEEHGSMFGLNVDDMVALPFRTYDQFFETGGTCSVIQAHVSDDRNADEVGEALEERLGDDFIVVSPMAAMDVQKQVTGTIQAVLGGIAAISMLVAGLGIVNTMAISVNERTREIGTMKAIGAKSVDILFLFMSEALFTGFLGGVVGASFGIAVAKLAGQMIGLPVESNFLLALGVVFFAMITSLLSGASPAWRASKLDPVHALRRE